MAHYEFHITAGAFLAAQRHALMSRQICFKDPILLGNTEFRVQRFEVGPNAIRLSKPGVFWVYHESFGELRDARVDGRQTQIAQDLVIHVATHADVVANPQQAAPIRWTLPLRVVLDVLYYAVNGQCFQRIAVSTVEWDDAALPKLPPGISLDEVKATVNAMILARFPSPAVPLDIAMSPLPGGGGGKVLNAGVTVDADLRYLVYRAELGPSTERADLPWGQFFSGSVDSRLQNADWGIFIGKAILEGAMTTLVWDSLKSEPISGAELISVGSSYGNAGGKAQITTTVYANFDAELGTVYVEPEIRTELSVRYPDWIVTNVHLPDIKAMVNGFLAPARSIIQRLPAPLSLILGGILDNFVMKVKDPTVPVANCIEVARLHHRCERFVPLPVVAGGLLHLERLDALADGVILVGRLNAPALTDGDLDSSFRAFEWMVPGGSCDSASAALAAMLASNPGLAPAEARISLRHTGTRPAYLCDFAVVDDPAGVFRRETIRVDDSTLPTNLIVRLTGLDPTAPRYPLRLMVYTTAGARLIQVPAVPALTQEVLDRLVAEQLLIVANCKAKMAPWWKYPRGFNPRWLIDPPFDRPVEHVWQFEVAGMRVGELISVFDGEDATVLTSVAVDGIARFGMVLGQAGEQGLRVVHSAPLRSGRGDDDERGIAMTQQLLLAQGSIGLTSPCRQVLRTGWWGDCQVVAVTGDGLTLFDLSTPSRPMVVNRWRVADSQAVFNGPGGLTAVGADGGYHIDPDGTMTRLGKACEPHRIAGAVPAPDGFYVLTGRSLELRTRDFCVRDSIPVEGGRALRRMGDRLVIARTGGITTLRVAADGTWADPEEHPESDLDVVGFGQSGEGPAGSVLAVLADGSACTLTMRDGRFIQTATYARAPWFATGTRIRDLVVRIGDDGRELLIGSLGEPRSVGADAMELESARL